MLDIDQQIGGLRVIRGTTTLPVVWVEVLVKAYDVNQFDDALFYYPASAYPFVLNWAVRRPEPGEVRS